MSKITRKVVIFGTGTGANTARRYFELDSSYEVSGYVVDLEHIKHTEFHGRPVVAIDDLISRFPPEEFLAFVPLGPARMNDFRADKYLVIKNLGYSFASYIHSSVQIKPNVRIGDNCFILENQSINFDTSIGDDVVIWSGCQIGDRSQVGNHCFLASHVVINGDVLVDDYSYLGSNCTISNGVKVGRQSFIGANSLITKDTEATAVHVVEPTARTMIDSKTFHRISRLK